MFPVGIGIITGVMKNVNLQFGSRCATGELATPLVSATMPALAYFILAMFGGSEGLEDLESRKQERILKVRGHDLSFQCIHQHSTITSYCETA